MHAFVWLGLVLFVLGLIGWLVFRITVAFAVVLFVVGLVLTIWGAIKARGVINRSV